MGIEPLLSSAVSQAADMISPEHPFLILVEVTASLRRVVVTLTPE